MPTGARASDNHPCLLVPLKQSSDYPSPKGGGKEGEYGASEFCLRGISLSKPFRAYRKARLLRLGRYYCLKNAGRGLLILRYRSTRHSHLAGRVAHPRIAQATGTGDLAHSTSLSQLWVVDDCIHWSFVSIQCHPAVQHGRNNNWLQFASRSASVAADPRARNRYYTSHLPACQIMRQKQRGDAD
jgi:hypothetical protein